MKDLDFTKVKATQTSCFGFLSQRKSYWREERKRPCEELGSLQHPS